MSLLQALHLPSRPPTPGQSQAPATPVTLAIAKPDEPFLPNARQGLSVVAFMADGKPQNYTNQAKWTSSNDALVKMLPGGIAQVGPGTGKVTITAAAPGGKPRDSVEVKVQAKLKDIVITPKNPLVEVGKNEVMTATGVYENGDTEDLTPWLDWSTDKDKVVDFRSNGGEWWGKGPGTATIAATDTRANVTGFVKVTVAAAGKGPKLVDVEIEPLNPDIKHGEAVQFRATGVFADKSRHEITQKVTWRTSRSEILVMDDDTPGLARPRLQSGNSLVAAVDEKANKGKSTTVYVDFPGIKGIDVEPKDITVRKGDVETLTITATLHNGGRMRVNDLVQFPRIDTAVAVVEPGGKRVIGVDPGHTEVEVFEPSSKQFTTFKVMVPPLRMVAIFVSPPSQTIRVGDVIDFIPVGRMEDGSSAPLGRPVWSSSERTVVDVDKTGRATAKATGDVVIHVQEATTGVMGHADVKVVP